MERLTLSFCVAGGSFDYAGELKASAAHLPLLSTEAQKALTVECLGQVAYATHYRSFGPQKIAFLDEFSDKAQEANNPAGHQETHPSQSLAPVTVPAIPQPEGLLAKLTQTQPIDPNWNYNTGIEPDPNYHAIQHYGDPLESSAAKENAAKIDTGWANYDVNDAGQKSYDEAGYRQCFPCCPPKPS